MRSQLQVDAMESIVKELIVCEAVLLVLRINNCSVVALSIEAVSDGKECIEELYKGGSQALKPGRRALCAARPPCKVAARVGHQSCEHVSKATTKNCMLHRQFVNSEVSSM